MTKARLFNEVLQREYGVDQTIADPITVRDLAIIVQTLKQGKGKKRTDKA
jgi:hypothetical protein